MQVCVFVKDGSTTAHQPLPCPLPPAPKDTTSSRHCCEEGEKKDCGCSWQERGVWNKLKYGIFNVDESTTDSI